LVLLKVCQADVTIFELNAAQATVGIHSRNVFAVLVRMMDWAMKNAPPFGKE
jgi:hypothetical protein